MLTILERQMGVDGGWGVCASRAERQLYTRAARRFVHQK